MEFGINIGFLSSAKKIGSINGATFNKKFNIESTGEP
jgi:hypothetical protein